MGQIEMEKPGSSGSLLDGNQQRECCSTTETKLRSVLKAMYKRSSLHSMPSPKVCTGSSSAAKVCTRGAGKVALIFAKLLSGPCCGLGVGAWGGVATDLRHSLGGLGHALF